MGDTEETCRPGPGLGAQPEAPPWWASVFGVALWGGSFALACVIFLDVAPLRSLTTGLVFGVAMAFVFRWLNRPGNLLDRIRRGGDPPEPTLKKRIH